MSKTLLTGCWNRWYERELRFIHTVYHCAKLMGCHNHYHFSLHAFFLLCTPMMFNVHAACVKLIPNVAWIMLNTIEEISSTLPWKLIPSVYINQHHNCRASVSAKRLTTLWKYCGRIKKYAMQCFAHSTNGYSLRTSGFFRLEHFSEREKLRAKARSICISMPKTNIENCNTLMCCRCRSLTVLWLYQFVYTLKRHNTTLEEHRATILRTFSFSQYLSERKRDSLISPFFVSSCSNPHS